MNADRRRAVARLAVLGPARGCYLPSGRYSKARVCRAPSASAYRNAFGTFDARFPWKGSPRLWGLHNYGDVNRRRTTSTKAMLRTVPGEVWLTETGGIVKLLPSFKHSPSRAAARTKGMFRLADTYDTRRPGMRSKITRLFVYSFTAPSPARASMPVW